MREDTFLIFKGLMLLHQCLLLSRVRRLPKLVLNTCLLLLYDLELLEYLSRLFLECSGILLSCRLCRLFRFFPCSCRRQGLLRRLLQSLCLQRQLLFLLFQGLILIVQRSLLSGVRGLPYLVLYRHLLLLYGPELLHYLHQSRLHFR